MSKKLLALVMLLGSVSKVVSVDGEVASDVSSSDASVVPAEVPADAPATEVDPLAAVATDGQEQPAEMAQTEEAK